MNKKVAVGLVLAFFVICVMIAGPLVALLAYVVWIGGALVEFYRLVELKKVKPLREAGIGFGLSFVILGYLFTMNKSMSAGGASVAVVITVYVIAILIIQFYQILKHNVRYSFIDLSVTVFGSLYLGGLSSYLFLVWGIGRELFPGDNFRSTMVLVMPMWGCWGTDAAAYFSGKMWGKTHFFPTISPNKTLEGAVGGVVASALGMAFIGQIVHISLGHGLLMGIICGIMGQVGDLCESAFKREINIKDTGDFLPAHGGFMDRLDSLLFTLPTAFYYLLWLRPWT